jgi:hypothetical protein
MESTKVIQTHIIPCNTVLAYKILPTHDTTQALACYSQPDLKEDWNACYAQFDPEHAMRYLPNHYDRGHDKAMLVFLRTKRPLRLCVISDPLLQRPDVDSATKAMRVRADLDRTFNLNLLAEKLAHPLMTAVGEEGDLLVALFDAMDLELVIPHQLFSPDYFHFETLVLFFRDEKLFYRTRSYLLEGLGNEHSREELQCSRDEMEDVCLLAETVLEKLNFPVSWTPLQSS